jgi:hypothetical protein
MNAGATTNADAPTTPVEPSPAQAADNTTTSTGPDVAAGDTTPPTEPSAEQKTLANVAATAPEQAITAPEAPKPPEKPAPEPPSSEKLALRAELDTLTKQQSAWAEGTEELRMAGPALERKKQYLAQGFLNPGDPPLEPRTRALLEANVAQLQERVDKANAAIAANADAAKQFDVVLNKYNAAK